VGGPSDSRGFGFPPLLVTWDKARDAFAGRLRPGNAGANTAAEHLARGDAALAQLPSRTPVPAPEHELDGRVRSDTASASLAWSTSPWPPSSSARSPVISPCPCRRPSSPCRNGPGSTPSTTTGSPARAPGLAAIPACLDLRGWPVGTRVIVRRKEPHPVAQLALVDPEGYCSQAFLTPSGDPDRLVPFGQRSWPKPQDPRRVPGDPRLGQRLGADPVPLGRGLAGLAAPSRTRWPGR